MDRWAAQAEESLRETTRLRAALCRPSVAAHVAAQTPQMNALTSGFAAEFAPFMEARLVRTAAKSTGKKIWRPAGGNPSDLYKTPQHFAN